MLLQDAIEGYLMFKSSRASEATIRAEKGFYSQFSRYIGQVEVCDITATHIREYLETLEERGLTKHSISRHYTCLSALWSWLTSDEIGLAKRHVVRTVPAPRPPKLKIETLSQEDIAALLDAAERTRYPKRGRSLVSFLLDTGCRISEVASLLMDDLDLKNNKALVLGKGSKERYVYFGKRCQKQLWLYIE
jgi:site-specific recombinase XerD